MWRLNKVLVGKGKVSLRLFENSDQKLKGFQSISGINLIENHVIGNTRHHHYCGSSGDYTAIVAVFDQSLLFLVPSKAPNVYISQWR